MKKQLFVIGLSSLSLCLAAADATSVPEVRLPLMAKAPVIDGTVGEGEWKGSALMQGFCNHRSAELFAAPASFRIGRDRERLYLAARCYVPPAGLIRKVPARKNMSTVADLDDSFEFVFIPDLGAKKSTIAHMIVNANGAVRATGVKDGANEAWFPENMVTKSSVTSDSWSFELSIPLADIGFTPETAARHGVRFCRNWYHLDPYAIQTCWGSEVGAFFSAARCPKVVFDDAAVAVEAVQVGGGVSKSVYPVKLRVTNPTAADVPVKVDILGRAQNSQPGAFTRTAVVAAGGSEAFEMEGPVLGDEPVDLTIRVASPDGKKAYYVRNCVFRPNGEPVKFRADGEEAEKIGFKFAYYPYHNKIRAAVDLANLETEVKSVTLEVKSSAGQSLAKTEVAVGAGKKADRIWEIPDLAEVTKKSGRDDYEIVLTVPGVEDGTKVRTFKRSVFEWEHNRLGKSDLVPPPFEKVKVRGEGEERTVSVILRDHTVDKTTGLWKQVTAAGKDLLARPIALVSGNRTIDQSEQSNNTSLSATAEWDVDGLMEWRLTLKPGHYEPMSLEIPVRAEIAKLMHASVDSLRSNYAGAIPKGTGRVWDGRKAAGRVSIIGDYLPYLWVGGPLRGISVFGENDRGWVVDGKPCQEIIRESDGTVTIRLNLVQRACDITEERTIRLGFMATPVKPMAEDWRESFEEPSTFLGCCWYWGGCGDSGDVAPYDEKTTFWEKMAEARRTGKVDKDYVKRYLAAYPFSEKPGTPEYEKKHEAVGRHFNAGMNRFAAMKNEPDMKTLAYTNGRGVRYGTPEGRTFCDEWNRFAFMSRDYAEDFWKAYDLDPVESYLDYAAWWWKKALELGVFNYLYWDDVFCQANFDLVGTDAYVMPDGEIQPATGIFNMREQVKRCRILQCELGVESRRNWIHMTNTAMAPVSSFAGVHYDWEDSCGEHTVQEHYTREYILACSLGRQFGNRVGIMGYFRAQGDELKRLEHTGVGPMLCFEFGWWRVKEYREVMKKLVAWGYRTPATKVWNYWDEDVAYPLSVTGAENASIAIAHPEKREAIVVVTDWNCGGGVSVRPDCDALGIRKDFKAVDFETGREYDVRDGTVGLKLEKCDYAILLLE